MIVPHAGTPQNCPLSPPGHQHCKTPGCPAVHLVYPAQRQAAAGSPVNSLYAKANMALPRTPHRGLKRRHFPAQGFNPGTFGRLQHTLWSK